MIIQQFLSKGLSELLLLSIIQQNDGISGYQIIKHIQNLTNNEIQLKAGTIYPQINQLAIKNLINQEIESVGDSVHMKKAIYSITTSGIKELNNAINSWQEFVNTITTIVNTGDKNDD